MSGQTFASAKLLVRNTGDDLAPFRSREYDLVVSALSWESRGTAAFERLSRTFSEIQLVKFSSTNPRANELKDQQLKVFARFANVCGLIELDSSVSFSSNVAHIDKFLRERVLSVRRPLKVLCDISCIPKSYLLLFLGLGFRKNYFARFDCLYSEGRYPLGKQHAAAASAASAAGSIISEGVWESLPVPFFESESTIPNHRDVLLSLGGEVGLTLPFIEKYEPRRLGLITIAESEVQNPEKLPKSEQYALSELQSEPNIERNDVPLCDISGLARYASEFCRASLADTVTALAIGSKTHALALGVAAFSQSRMEVICRIPKRYTMLDVESNGRVAGFEIEDRFEPNAYLS